MGSGFHGAGGGVDIVAGEGERGLDGERICGGGGEEARGGDGFEVEEAQ